MFSKLMAPPCPPAPEFRSREAQDGRHNQGHQSHGNDDPGRPLPVVGNEDPVGEDQDQHADDAALDRARQPPGVDDVCRARTCIPRYCPSAKKATTMPNVISSSARVAATGASTVPTTPAVYDQQQENEGVRVDQAFEQVRHEDVTDQKDREPDRQHDRRCRSRRWSMSRVSSARAGALPSANRWFGAEHLAWLHLGMREPGRKVGRGVRIGHAAARSRW